MKIDKSKIESLEKELLQALSDLNDAEINWLLNDTNILAKLKRRKTRVVSCCICNKQMEATNYAHQNKQDFFIGAEIDDGVINLLNPRYASNYDNDKLVAAFCDKCIGDKLVAGVIIDAG